MKLPPQPSDFLVAKHFDRLAINYDAKAANRAAYLGAIDTIIIDHIGASNRPNPVILDVGTGTGNRLEELGSRLPHAYLHGCDMSDEMVEIARGKNLDTVRKANMTELPYLDQSFDHLLVLFNAFGYLPTAHQRRVAMGEFWRVLKPGGSVVMDVLNRWHTGEGEKFKKNLKIIRELAKSAFSPTLELGDVIFYPDPTDKSCPGFFHSFTDREVRKLVLGAGFSIIDAKVVGYDTGRTHIEKTKGNLVYLLEKPVL